MQVIPEVVQETGNLPLAKVWLIADGTVITEQPLAIDSSGMEGRPVSGDVKVGLHYKFRLSRELTGTP